jgi:hypothetical protein
MKAVIAQSLSHDHQSPPAPLLPDAPPETISIDNHHVHYSKIPIFQLFANALAKQLPAS